MALYHDGLLTELIGSDIDHESIDFEPGVS
jgi:hypothetical protein